ncbi:MFS transporter [Oenococcus sicerae]|uniref:MFS transporter n=2 Tax=Oenococcus sicerae TaxID=2203724 RepID=A0ABX5QKQ5_9LACO|nr:MFS transporter [Oenococcus sicerae]
MLFVQNTNSQVSNKLDKDHICILIALGMLTFMSVLDGSIVNIALPSISKDLHIPLNQATWTVIVYLIVISGLLLLFGRMGDVFGKIKIFKIGTVIFTIGSFLAGISEFGLIFLLAARVVQAIGASMAMATSFGITTSNFPASMRARAMSITGMFVSLGAIAGPAIGGAILSLLSWSYIFWVNVPFGLLTILIGIKYFPKDTIAQPDEKIDYTGSILFFAFIAIFFLAVNAAEVVGFQDILVISGLVISILFLIAFIKVENVIKEPMIKLEIFKNQLYSISLTTAFLVFAINSYTNILMPFYLQDLRKLTPGQTGLILMCFPIANFIFSPISGWAGDKFDKELITLIGLAGLTLSQIGYLSIGGASPYLLLVITLIANGMSSAIFMSPNNALTMSTVPRPLLGIAGSVTALARNVGFIVGNTFATTMLFIGMSQLAGYRVVNYLPKHPEYFIQSMHWSFIFAALMSLLAFALTLYRMLKRNALHKYVARN